MFKRWKETITVKRYLSHYLPYKQNALTCKLIYDREMRRMFLI